MFFQPKDLVWLDPCDKHRDEEIKHAAAESRSQQALECCILNFGGLEYGFWGQVCVKPKHDGERGVAGLPRHFEAPTGRVKPLTVNKKTLLKLLRRNM